MVRTPSIGSVQYNIGLAPENPEELQRFLDKELFKIQAAINALAIGHIDKSFVAPAKPRDGDIRYADGTTWNPGAGSGVYIYKVSTWVLLG